MRCVRTLAIGAAIEFVLFDAERQTHLHNFASIAQFRDAHAVVWVICHESKSALRSRSIIIVVLSTTCQRTGCLATVEHGQFSTRSRSSYRVGEGLRPLRTTRTGISAR